MVSCREDTINSRCWNLEQKHKVLEELGESVEVAFVGRMER